MSQNLNNVHVFDGTNYGYSKARMRFFLKSIDYWNIVETSWTKPADATLKLVTEKNARLSNDKALHALCQALSPSELVRISNSESAKEAWQILETTYECTKLVKFAKLQMLISRFEEIKMLEDEIFGEFYSKMNDLRNSMVSLGKTVSDVKLIRKILRSLPERFRIKVTTIEESKDLEEMKIKELVGSLQIYELSLPPIKKLKTIALKASKKKVEVSSGDDSEDEEKAVAMLPKNFERLMRNELFKKKFSEKMKKAPGEAELEEAKKKDPRGPRCFECSRFGDMRADCGNLKQGKGKAYITTLSDESEEEEEAPEQEKFLGFVAQDVEEEDSYCSFMIGLILFGQNHLYVKMPFYKGFLYSKVFQKILQSEKSVPCQPSGRHVIPSGRSSVTVPFVRTTCHTVQTTYHTFWTPRQT